MRKIALVAITPFLLLGLLSCGAEKKQAIEEKPIAVTLAEAAVKDIILNKTYTGTLEGSKQAMIYASIPEAVISLPVSEGSQVQAGQPIIILDKEGPSSQYRQAEAAYLDAKDNYEKMGKLFEQGAISEQTYNNVKTGFDIARANFAAAKQQVELTSPITGVLTDLAVNVGQYAPLGIPLATIAQTGEMRLNIYVDGRGANYIREGQTAQISVNVAGDTISGFIGQVSKVARSADPNTRLFAVTIEVDNAKKELRPGMFARATINIAQLDRVLTIPKDAVFVVEGIARVYKLNSDRAVEQAIQIGESSPSDYQVLSGLNAGEKVILLGRNLVQDGSLVKVVESTTPSAADNSR